MKAVRTHEYRIDGYGTVMFIRTHLGSGHCSFKVFWRRAGEEKGTRIAWMQEGRKPSAKLAILVQGGLRQRRRPGPVSLPR
jgi:hypothetical protein